MKVNAKAIIGALTKHFMFQPLGSLSGESALGHRHKRTGPIALPILCLLKSRRENGTRDFYATRLAAVVDCEGGLSQSLGELRLASQPSLMIQAKVVHRSSDQDAGRAKVDRLRAWIASPAADCYSTRVNFTVVGFAAGPV